MGQGKYERERFAENDLRAKVASGAIDLGLRCNLYVGPFKRFGVTDGIRTHDNRNHNPGLYQLSYRHHRLKRQAGIVSSRLGIC